MIVIVSFHDNAHVHAVLEHLDRPAVVVDVADFPHRSRLEVRLGCTVCEGGDRLRLTVRDDVVDVAEVGAVWYRRERPMQLDPALTDPTAQLFAWSESREALTGLWHAMDCFWMNPPAADEVGQRKIRQLQVAREVGLEVPSTLITNDPVRAREFVMRHEDSGVIRKAFRNIAEAPRATALVTAADQLRLEEVRYAPVTFQEYVPVDVDLRVIVVGEEVFAAAIKSTPEYAVDYRGGIGSAVFTPYLLPEEVETRLLALHRRLGLEYGASDFRVTPDGRHVFLEVNPGGEYLFMTERTGQPVPQAIAALLSRHDREHG